MERQETEGFVENYSLEDLVQQGDPEEVKECLYELYSQISSLETAGAFQALTQLVEKEDRVCEWTFKSVRRKEPMAFYVGCYATLVGLYREFMERKWEQEQLDLEMERAWDSFHDRQDEIIAYIHNNRGVRHGKMAEELGILKSTLTGIMDKLEQADMVYSTRISKFKQYYLTPPGERYYSAHLSKRKTGPSEREMEQYLAEMMAHAEDPSKEIGQFVSQVIEQMKQEPARQSEDDAVQKQTMTQITTQLVYTAIRNSNASLIVGGEFKSPRLWIEDVIGMCDPADGDSVLYLETSNHIPLVERPRRKVQTALRS